MQDSETMSGVDILTDTSSNRDTSSDSMPFKGTDSSLPSDGTDSTLDDGAVILVDTAGKKDSDEEFPDNILTKPICLSEESPMLNNCRLPCTDGWHATSNGSCVVDCPAGTVEDENGECRKVCAEGFKSVTETMLDGTEELSVSYCQPPCPENMVPADGSCDIQCNPPWAIDTDGHCHLQCPDNMVAIEDDIGCTLKSVGENSICSEGKWNTDIEGINPIFVDPATGDASGDGTQAAPYATIQQAVDAAGDSATVYLAPGTYDEQIVVDRKEMFSLIGRCPSEVVISPTSYESYYNNGGDDIFVGSLSILNTNRIRLHGLTVRAPVESGSGVVIGSAFTTDAASSEELERTVELNQIAVDQAGLIGISVSSGYQQTIIQNSSVTAGHFGIEIGVMSENASEEGEVQILNNMISDLTAISDELNVVGIAVNNAHKIRVEGNQVSDISYAFGMMLWYFDELEVIGNIVSNVSGMSGIHIIGSAVADSVSKVTITDNILHGLHFGSCAFPQCTKSGINGIDVNLFESISLIEAKLSRNRIEKVQGMGINMGSDYDDGNSLIIDSSEVNSSTLGIWCSEGTLSIVDSRFRENWQFVSAGTTDGETDLESVRIEGSVFEDRVVDPTGMTGGIASMMGKIVSGIVISSALGSDSIANVRGNVIRNHRMYSDETQPDFMLLRVGQATVSQNVFEQNKIQTIRISSGVSSIYDNIFRSNDIGIIFSQAIGRKTEIADVHNNLFYRTVLGVTASWEQDAGKFLLENNEFYISSLRIGAKSETTTAASEISIRRNFFSILGAKAGIANKLDIQENYFDNCNLTVWHQPEGSQSEVSNNLFNHGYLEIFKVQSEIEVENNSLLGNVSDSESNYWGAGIGVHDSVGPIRISHNIIGQYESRTLPGIGMVGDGIQVIGVGSNDESNVWIDTNIVHSNGRYGGLLINAEGTLESNMFFDNGTSSSDDLVSITSGDGSWYGSDVRAMTLLSEEPSTVDIGTIQTGL